MSDAGELLEVGTIGRAHGTGGEVVVRLVTNRVERLDPGGAGQPAQGEDPFSTLHKNTQEIKQFALRLWGERPPKTQGILARIDSGTKKTQVYEHFSGVRREPLVGAPIEARNVFSSIRLAKSCLK